MTMRLNERVYFTHLGCLYVYYIRREIVMIIFVFTRDRNYWGYLGCGVKEVANLLRLISTRQRDLQEQQEQCGFLYDSKRCKKISSLSSASAAHCGSMLSSEPQIEQ